MDSQCRRGRWVTRPDLMGWNGDETETVFIPDCKTKTIHTFLDRCEVCGKEFRYSNTHNYPTTYHKD